MILTEMKKERSRFSLNYRSRIKCSVGFTLFYDQLDPWSFLNLSLGPMAKFYSGDFPYIMFPHRKSGRLDPSFLSVPAGFLTHLPGVHSPVGDKFWSGNRGVGK